MVQPSSFIKITRWYSLYYRAAAAIPIVCFILHRAKEDKVYQPTEAWAGLLSLVLLSNTEMSNVGLDQVCFFKPV